MEKYMIDGKMKLLLVEDDEALAGEIGTFLGRWGYETVAVRQFDKVSEEFGDLHQQPG